MSTISELVVFGANALQRDGIDDPRREASSLLELAIGRDRTFMIAHPEFEPGQDLQNKFLEFVQRRSRGEPFHYIRGSKEFYGLEFEISPAVLIPRPETEMLVEISLRYLEKIARPRFAEVGVGSGCISVAVLANSPTASAVGLDISDTAIEVAAINASGHGVSSRLELRTSDIFSGLRASERFDLIVSNPPYIPAADISTLQPDVREHEPLSALTDGGDGLSLVRCIIAGSPQHLVSGGLLAFEIGIGQWPDVESMFDGDIWAEAAVDEDLQGIARAVSATLKPSGT